MQCRHSSWRKQYQRRETKWVKLRTRDLRYCRLDCEALEHRCVLSAVAIPALAVDGSADNRIIDDGDADHKFVGGWNRGALTGGYGQHYWFDEAGSGAEKSIWTFTGLPAGTYDVFATWTAHVNRATNAPFTISGGTGQKTVRVNQERTPRNDAQSRGVSFQRLASVVVDGRGTLTVTLTDAANEYVIADAVWVKSDLALNPQTVDQLFASLVDSE